MEKYDILCQIIDEFRIDISSVVRNGDDGLGVVFIWQEVRAGGRECRWEGFSNFNELVDDLIKTYEDDIKRSQRKMDHSAPKRRV